MIEKKYVCNICGEKDSEALYRGQLTDIIRQQIVVLEKRKSTTIPRKYKIHLCEECKTLIEAEIRDGITKIARKNGQLQTTKNSPPHKPHLDGLELHKQKEEDSE